VKEVESIFDMATRNDRLAGALPSSLPSPPAADPRRNRCGTEHGDFATSRIANLESLPPWARQLSEKYYSRTLAMFVLYGNVRDLAPIKRGDAVEFLPMRRFLSEALFGKRDLIIMYDRGGGLSFADPAMQQDFQRALSGYDSFHGTTYSQGLPRNTDGVLNCSTTTCAPAFLDGKKIALTIDFAETIAPAGDVSSMSAEDRNALVILKRWAENPAVPAGADVTVCLIAENQSELNQSIGTESRRGRHRGAAAGRTGAPPVHPLSASLRRAAARLRRFRRYARQARSGPQAGAAPEPDLPFHREQLPLTLKFLREVKKELIEAESGGLLEFVQSRFDLSMVAGSDAAKKLLTTPPRPCARAAPTCCRWATSSAARWGPGKTFLTTCFAGEVASPP